MGINHQYRNSLDSLDHPLCLVMPSQTSQTYRFVMYEQLSSCKQVCEGFNVSTGSEVIDGRFTDLLTEGFSGSLFKYNQISL